MANVLRAVVALFYLLGWMVHIIMSLTAPEGYAVFGETALIPAFRDFWFFIIMPRITFFAFLLAGFELTVGILIASKGRWVRYGLLASVAFDLFLIQLGLGTPAADWVSDFAMNRLPNVIFGLLHIPLFLTRFPETLPGVVAGKFRGNVSSRRLAPK